jgi:hypothetical protein
MRSRRRPAAKPSGRSQGFLGRSTVERPIAYKPVEHVCSVCLCEAHFGVGVALLFGREGTWFCYEHWPNRPMSQPSSEDRAA